MSFHFISLFILPIGFISAAAWLLLGTTWESCVTNTNHQVVTRES